MAPATVTKPPEGTLDEQHAAAQAHLADLAREEAGLSERYREAARAGNAAAMVAVSQRRDTLPAELHTARVAVARLQLERWRAEGAQAEADLAARYAEIEAALVPYRQAQAALESAQNWWEEARERRLTVRQEIAAAERELAQVIAAASTPPGAALRGRR